MFDCKFKLVLCVLGIEKESEDLCILSDFRLYREIVGSFIYVMIGIRFDLCYVVIKFL